MIQAKNVRVDGNYLHVEVMDGRILLIPLVWYQPLALAIPEKRQLFRLIARNTMIEWEDLDFHLDIEEMFRVDFEEMAS